MNFLMMLQTSSELTLKDFNLTHCSSLTTNFFKALKPKFPFSWSSNLKENRDMFYSCMHLQDIESDILYISVLRELWDRQEVLGFYEAWSCKLLFLWLNFHTRSLSLVGGTGCINTVCMKEGFFCSRPRTISSY